MLTNHYNKLDIGQINWQCIISYHKMIHYSHHPLGHQHNHHLTLALLQSLTSLVGMLFFQVSLLCVPPDYYYYTEDSSREKECYYWIGWSRQWRSHHNHIHSVFLHWTKVQTYVDIKFTVHTQWESHWQPIIMLLFLINDRPTAKLILSSDRVHENNICISCLNMPSDS